VVKAGYTKTRLVNITPLLVLYRNSFSRAAGVNDGRTVEGFQSSLWVRGDPVVAGCCETLCSECFVCGFFK